MRKYLYGLFAFVLAFAILLVSVLRSSSVSPAYEYSSYTIPLAANLVPIPVVNYNLPYPGTVLPDSPLWYLKAARDKLQYFVTADSLKKAELALLYSDKRLGASGMLLENKKPETAMTVLLKGEKYLEIAAKEEALARKNGVDTADFLIKLTNASLKHREYIERVILPNTPEAIRPEIVKAEDYSKNTYKNCIDVLGSKGIIAPKNPFI
jgi:hypothetical protein